MLRKINWCVLFPVSVYFWFFLPLAWFIIKAYTMTPVACWPLQKSFKLNYQWDIRLYIFGIFCSFPTKCKKFVNIQSSSFIWHYNWCTASQLIYLAVVSRPCYRLHNVFIFISINRTVILTDIKSVVVTHVRILGKQIEQNIEKG